ncbi:hypothetical protein TL16_g09694, partial [Triparma laevis f. inornata]
MSDPTPRSEATTLDSPTANPPPAPAPAPAPSPAPAPAPAPTPSTAASAKHVVAIDQLSAKHQTLKKYEEGRRAKNKKHFDSNNLYWKSFRGLLNDAVLETDRALEIVEARAIIDRHYAESLEAIGMGNVDETNAPITSLSGNKGKQKQKKRQAADKEAGAARRGSLRMNAEGLLESRAASELGMLQQLIMTHGDCAARYNENVAVITNEIMPDLQNLVMTLSEEVGNITAYGDAIMLELEAAELKAADELVENSVCVWVDEMKYTLSVVLLQRVWKAANEKLGELFNRMKNLEFDRRVKMQELMILFMQRQEQLWVALPAIQGPCLKGLTEKTVERGQVDEDIGAAIRTGAQNIQMSQVTAKMAEEGFKLDGEGGEEARARGSSTVTVDELDSPLKSALLGKAKVVEKRKEGMMGGWKPVLALVTADNFLHIFDIPTTAKVQSGSAPEVAFNSLIPSVDIPDVTDVEALVKKGKALPSNPGEIVRDWHNLMHPDVSVNLPNTKIAFLPKSSDSAFEIEETVKNHGASAMFSKTSKRKLVLRAVSQEEAVDWIVTLKAQ